MLSISARLLPSPTISNNPKSLTPTFSGRHHNNSTSILQLSGGSGLSLFLTDSRFSPIADLLSCGTCHSKTVLQTAAREFSYLISAKRRIHCIHHKYPAIPSASSAFLVPDQQFPGHPFPQLTNPGQMPPAGNWLHTQCHNNHVWVIC